jgi:hypothetical protein
MAQGRRHSDQKDGCKYLCKVPDAWSIVQGSHSSSIVSGVAADLVGQIPYSLLQPLHQLLADICAAKILCQLQRTWAR